MFKFMRFCIKSFLYCNKFRVNMIIIKTEMSVRKINHRVLGLVLPRLSSEPCSKEREKTEGKKDRKRKGDKKMSFTSKPHNNQWELLR